MVKYDKNILYFDAMSQFTLNITCVNRFDFRWGTIDGVCGWLEEHLNYGLSAKSISPYL